LVDTETIFDYNSETFQLPDGSYVNCEILDTGGQEKFNAINRQYYQRADCCVLVYDITRKDTFKECKNFYKKEIINNCKKGIKVILVGNKTDLEKDRKITNKEGADLAKKNNYYFKETSCETNTNVADVFETIILMTHKDMIKSGKFNYNEKENMETFKLTAEKNVLNDKTKQKKKCC
jgi:small GTP-binding protein